MAHLFPSAPIRRPAGLGLWAGLFAPLLVASLPAAWAQVADVAAPDAQGDFSSITLTGARGAYRQQFWLVVDPDPRGLWCRDLRGRKVIALRRGAVVATAATGPALLVQQGKPHLRVQTKFVDILYDARRGERGTAPTCLVRANIAFLAPIHPDSLQAVLQLDHAVEPNVLRMVAGFR